MHHCVQTVLIHPPPPLPHTTKFPVHHLFNNVSHGNRQITATVDPKGRNLCFSLRPMCMTPCLLGLPTPTSPPFNPSGQPSWNRNRPFPPLCSPHYRAASGFTFPIPLVCLYPFAFRFHLLALYTPDTDFSTVGSGKEDVVTGCRRNLIA